MDDEINLFWGNNKHSLCNTITLALPFIAYDIYVLVYKLIFVQRAKQANKPL